MWKRSFDPKAAAGRAVSAAVRAVGDRLVGATLYGSAAGGDFLSAHSDVNVAFVFSALGPEELEALRPAHRVWQRSRVTRPLLLSRDGLSRSIDVFPLEYLLIRERHETLHGEDCFGNIEIDRNALSRAIERSLRAQEMGLAWTYIALAGTPSGARHWAGRAGTAIAVAASGLLHLAGEPIPQTRRELTERCAALFGIERESLRGLLERGPEARDRVEATRLLNSAQRILTRLTEAAD